MKIFVFTINKNPWNIDTEPEILIQNIDITDVVF